MFINAHENSFEIQTIKKQNTQTRTIDFLPKKKTIPHDFLFPPLKEIGTGFR
jgi:hypothetical protein